jgi:hypothetical protein
MSGQDHSAAGRPRRSRAFTLAGLGRTLGGARCGRHPVRRPVSIHWAVVRMGRHFGELDLPRSELDLPHRELDLPVCDLFRTVLY